MAIADKQDLQSGLEKRGFDVNDLLREQTPRRQRENSATCCCAWTSYRHVLCQRNHDTNLFVFFVYFSGLAVGHKGI